MGFRSHLVPLVMLFGVAWSLCSCTSIQQTHLHSNQSKKTNHNWPPRLAPTLPKIETEKGNNPVPLGIFKNCQVIRISHGKPDPLLLFASRTNEPVRISGDESDLNLTVDNDHIARVTSKYHRLTIAELQAARATPARGTVIYLGSIVGVAPAEQKLISTLRLDGWNIISCLPPFESFADIAELTVKGPNDIPNAAQRFAERIDQHLAERAYVAESAIAYVKQTRPDWLTSRIVVVGSSAGALALPAVAATLPKVDSAVLTGGGANVPAVILRSSLELSKIVMQLEEGSAGKTKDRSLTDAELDRFEELAFGYMNLDPAYLAPILDQKPTLLILGTRDTIVPAANGHLLHQKLSQPEIWQYPMGHNVLMGTLPLRAPKIKDWLGTKNPTEIAPSPIPFEKRKRIRVRLTDNTAEETGREPIPRR